MAVSGELVRIDYNFNGGATIQDDLAHLLTREIEPFIVGVGKVRMEDAPKQSVIIRADLGIKDDRHY
jgi:hypothetical protein